MYVNDTKQQPLTNSQREALAHVVTKSLVLKLFDPKQHLEFHQALMQHSEPAKKPAFI